MSAGFFQFIRVLLYGLAVLAGGFLLLRFLLPWAAPFIVAFLLAALMEPIVFRLVRCRWKRSAAAGLVTLSLLALIVYGLVKLTVWLASAASQLVEKLPLMMESLAKGIEKLEVQFSHLAAAVPQGMGEYAAQAMESMGELLYAMPAAVSQWVLDLLGKAAQSSPHVLLFAVTAGIGTYFISASYPRTTAFLMAQIPTGIKERFSGFGKDVRGSFGGFFRSQLILMVMTFAQLLAAFFLLGQKNAMLIAAVTAFVDALPVFGAGIVLVPWAIYGLLLGNSWQGIGLLICWLVVSLVRNCAQAKLLGDQIGLDPLASLLAIYVGWQVWNIWGMLLFPLLLVTLQQLNDKGIIKLWNKI